MVIANSKAYKDAADAANAFLHMDSNRAYYGYQLEQINLPKEKHTYLQLHDKQQLFSMASKAYLAYRTMLWYETEYHGDENHPQYDPAVHLQLPITVDFYKMRELLPIKGYLTELVKLPTKVNQDLLRKLMPIKTQLESIFR